MWQDELQTGSGAMADGGLCVGNPLLRHIYYLVEE
jgi:hypothetical protein